MIAGSSPRAYKPNRCRLVPAREYRLPRARATLRSVKKPVVDASLQAGPDRLRRRRRRHCRAGQVGQLDVGEPVRVPVALGADDPLLFGPRLTAQYEIARHAHGFSDVELADLARTSVLSSAAPGQVRAGLLAAIDDWLAL